MEPMMRKWEKKIQEERAKTNIQFHNLRMEIESAPVKTRTFNVYKRIYNGETWWVAEPVGMHSGFGVPAAQAKTLKQLKRKLAENHIILKYCRTM
jgi:hypothetical protein